MLEALTREKLRDKLGVISDESGAPAIAPVAGAVRNVVQAWRFPARQRVSGYLHRQFVAAGYAEESVRMRVADVIDSLIDIGDLTVAQIDGKRCLVSSLGSFVKIGESEHAVLGMTEGVNESSESWRYARAVSAAPDDASVIDFHEWIDSAAFRRHLTRRLAGSDDGTIREFWTALTSALRNEGSSIDRVQVRAVIAPPNSQNSFFGRHNVPAPSGRWSSDIPNGTWCAVRPGRNSNEWHPILVNATGDAVTALDCYDWDEWTWALLARGIVMNMPERSFWERGVVVFEHPLPNQLIRALRLMGGPGERRWTWRMSEGAFRCFEEWRHSEI